MANGSWMNEETARDINVNNRVSKKPNLRGTIVSVDRKNRTAEILWDGDKDPHPWDFEAILLHCHMTLPKPDPVAP